nr:MAG TPA: hypothetical protein [Caudoviricetes sp.]
MIYCICDQAIPNPRVCGGDCKKSKAYRLITKKETGNSLFFFA